MPDKLTEQLKKLQAPFPAEDVEWRVGSSGKKADGAMWAMVMPYITNRGVMNRLDEVFGAGGWQNKFEKAPEGGILCGISVKIGEEWVTKWDGAENTKEQSGMEGTAVKGGLSGAQKRAAVQWGIGRYLYNLDSAFVKVLPSKQGGASNYINSKKTGVQGYWATPQLPASALPAKDKTEAKVVQDEPAPEVVAEPQKPAEQPAAPKVEQAPAPAVETPPAAPKTAKDLTQNGPGLVPPGLRSEVHTLIGEAGFNLATMNAFVQIHVGKEKPENKDDYEALAAALRQHLADQKSEAATTADNAAEVATEGII